ncbi:MAG: hypothetical protein KDE34_16180 [Anaerolineales bacterium]|nr:hypothetical protein [Anaerolineales bacterium]
MRKHVLPLIFVFGLLLAHWIRPVPVQACTTTPEGQPAPTLQDRIDHASLIFTGTVVAMEGEMYEEVAVIAVSHYFKGGDGASQVKVGSWGDGAVCRRMVAVGESWLFYVMDYGNGTLHADWYTAGGAVAPPNPDFLASITELTAALPVTQPADAGQTAEIAETTPEAAETEVSPDSAPAFVTEIPAPPPQESPGAVPVPDDRPAQLPPSSFGFLPMMIVVLGLLCAFVLLALVVGVFLLRRNRGKVS